MVAKVKFSRVKTQNWIFDISNHKNWKINWEFLPLGVTLIHICKKSDKKDFYIIAINTYTLKFM
jgi:hypothetical protein